MSNILEQLRLKAWRYAVNHGLELSSLLGNGQDGAVWKTTANTAVKVFEKERQFNAERRSYQRLADFGITSLSVFTVPALVDYDDSLMIVEMSVVSPPYFLDFGKCYLDHPPEYEDGTWDEYIEEKSKDFDPEAWQFVEEALLDLKSMGIYYIDPKPANIRFLKSQ